MSRNENVDLRDHCRFSIKFCGPLGRTFGFDINIFILKIFASGKNEKINIVIDPLNNARLFRTFYFFLPPEGAN